MGILFKETSIGGGMVIRKDGKKILEVRLKETSGKDNFKTAKLEVKYLGNTYVKLMTCGKCLKNLPEGLMVGLGNGNHQWYEEKANIFYKANDEYKFDKITPR